MNFLIVEINLTFNIRFYNQSHKELTIMSHPRFNENLFPIVQFRFLEPGEKIRIGDLVFQENGLFSHMVEFDDNRLEYDDAMLPAMRKRYITEYTFIVMNGNITQTQYVLLQNNESIEDAMKRHNIDPSAVWNRIDGWHTDWCKTKRIEESKPL